MKKCEKILEEKVKRNIYNILIISFICLFFLGCSSSQVIDVSKQDQVDILLSKIGDTELKISTNEDIKKLIIESIVSLKIDNNSWSINI